MTLAKNCISATLLLISFRHWGLVLSLEISQAVQLEAKRDYTHFALN